MRNFIFMGGEMVDFKKQCLMLLLIVVFMVAVAGPVLAAVMVSQSHDQTKSGEYSNLGTSNQQVADDFALTQSFSLDKVTWYGRYGDKTFLNNGEFYIRFFADDGGKPKISYQTQFVVNVTPVFSGYYDTDIPWYKYSVSVSGLTMDPGTYWISIVETDNRTSASGNTQWLWGDSSTSGLRAHRNADNVVWSVSTDIDHAFVLEGVGAQVPLPSSLLLLLTALSLVLLVNKWRRG